MRLKKLTKIGLQKWLKQKKQTAIIGQQFNGQWCPIANYLKDVTGKKVCVTMDGIQIWNQLDEMIVEYINGLRIVTDVYGTNVYDLPVWAKAFITEIDDKNKQALAFKKITAGRALKVLNSI